MRINKPYTLQLDNGVEIFAGSVVTMRIKYHGWVTGMITAIINDAIMWEELGAEQINFTELWLIEEVEVVE